MSSSNTPPTWDLTSSSGTAQTLSEATEGPIAHPTQIGLYRILSVLGEGGMGLVYIAEQREPVHRRVAIKVIKLGMDTRDVVGRFQAERQALALMDHPNIARVYEAGATETGRPYFAMELVSGVPITRFCDEQKLSTPQRLELFAIVCDAVQHAHAKGIIHRDIKPGNVLVTQVDGKPIPKVIDFGIAKATNQRLTERTVFTELGRMIGTPEYMSPEQADSVPLDVDTRTDVYSLGVLLYELLTGTLPYDPKELRSHGYESINRMIREIDPPRPSTRFYKLSSDDATTRAEKRRETIDSLGTLLRRELEWIPLKAMRKDREHRYRTASELADDVRNYLHRRPLIAGPETRSYRARKFLRRNRATVTAASVMLLLLMAGIVATTYQAIRATRAERQAEQRYDDARTIARDLIFDLHPQIEKLAGSSGATKQLAATSVAYLKKLAAQSSNDPTLLRDISVGYQQLGDIQGNPNRMNRGDITAAEESYRLALAAAEQGLTIKPLDEAQRRKLVTARASSIMKLGDVLAIRTDPKGALIKFTEAHEIMQQLTSFDRKDFKLRHNEVITLPRVMSAHLALGDVSAALAVAETQLELAQSLARDFPTEAPAKSVLASAYGQLSDAAIRAGKIDRGIDALRQSVAINREIADAAPDDAQAQQRLATCHASLADALDMAGREAEASDACDQAVQIARRSVTLDPMNLRAREMLGQVLLRGGDFALGKEDPDRAATLYNEAIELYRKSLQISPNHPSSTQMLAVTYGQLAELERRRERFDASVAAHQAGIDTLMPLINASPNNMRLRGGLAFALRNLSQTMLDSGRLDDALSTARRALELEKEICNATPDDNRAVRNRLLTQYAVARVLVAIADRPDRSREQRDRERTEARSFLTSSLAEMDASKRSGTFAVHDDKFLEKVKNTLAQLDAPSTKPSTQP